MPFGAIYEISKGWSLGPEYCDMWTSSDVLCCTASILHLVAIAVDRYWAVTNVDYIHTRNGNRIGGMIVVVWSVALIVSLAPQFGWKDDQYLDRINKERRCLPSQDIGYQIFATCSTFYVPLLVILILYWKIFQTARKRIHRRREQRVPDSLSSKTNNNSNDARITKNFLTKRKFLRMKKCKSKKKSTAAEALVSSLVMVEGHSTTTVDVVQEFDEKASSGNHPNNEETTTAFTISKSTGTTETAMPMESAPTESKVGATSNNVSPEKSSATTTNNGSASHQSHISDISRVEILTKDQQLSITTPQATATHTAPSPGLLHPHDHNKDKNSNSNIATLTRDNRRDKKESLEAKRERKAAKTLAIITGAFVVCWLPFFVMALVMPLCSSCVINDYVASIFLWLGYFNSTLNPVIYTIFSPEFRQAFTRILCGARSGPGGARGTRNFRSGKIR
ncbi:5-hydroxytryptamine receptor-like [Chrysoperla carnea]|uniref:5-hydroxytryptamine receptor-like n=1 Tax=Chrysoperla carnea TaxID=189513 RepID=UPI001D06547F|nr:5-hydroxytryptamine receptor-like [Chrysoperla carnea]